MTVTPFRKTRRRTRRVVAQPSRLLSAESRAWLRRAHWVLPVAFTAWAWWRLGKLGGGEWLAITTGVALLLWPLAVLWVLYGLPAMLRALVPREWRANRRKGRPRPAIPARLQRVAFAAYHHRCVSCGASSAELVRAGRVGLQVEHIMPWSRGGLNSMWNLTLLCGAENVLKSDYWKYRSGRVYYKCSFEGVRPNAAEAARILSRERRRRANLTRWLAIAWLLAVGI